METILIINKRNPGSLFHYAHFICDCLYTEIINDIHINYKKVVRIKNIDQTLGNFVKIYEEVMKIPSIEMDVAEFYKQNITPIILDPKEKYTDITNINKFREYIFNIYNINSLEYLDNYPEIILIKRGGRIQLIDDEELKVINTNISTGKERREIKDIDKIHKYLNDKYTNKFQTILLEDKSFEEQVKLFNNAKLIITAHGAAMSNLFFCKKNTTVIEITCGVHWPFFDVISKQLELKHIKIDNNNSDHIIDVISLQSSSLH